MRVLFFHPEGNISNNANLYYLVKWFKGTGSDVTIISHRHDMVYQSEENLLLFDPKSFKESVNIVYKLKRSVPFDLIIGIDAGIIDANLWHRILRTPYVFISYEILFDDEIKRKDYHRFKAAQRKAASKITFAVVQDPKRAELFANEYRIDEKKVKLMPVAGSGIKKVADTRYFHKKYSLSEDKKILLFMGSVNEKILQLLITMAKFLPNEWVLVVHSRYKYSHGFQKKENVYFSFEQPVEKMEDMGILLSDTDVGLCAYLPDYTNEWLGKNIKYIGLSSGKASTFLQYGIPILVYNMNIWDECVEENEIGGVMRNFEDMKIVNSLKGLKENCWKFFSERLDLINFAPVIFNDLPKVKYKFNRINFSILLLKIYKTHLIRKLKKLRA